MNTIIDIDLDKLVTDSVSNVFETMISLTYDAKEKNASQKLVGTRVIGTVGFAGERACGAVYIQLPDAFAKQVTQLFMGLEPEDELEPDDVNDVIGELSNMVGGTINSRISDAGFSCNLTPPCITRGTGYSIEVVENDHYENFTFSFGEHRINVELHMRTAEA